MTTVFSHFKSYSNMKRTKYAPIRAPVEVHKVPIKKPYHAVRSIIRHKKAVVVGLKDYINFFILQFKITKNYEKFPNFQLYEFTYLVSL